MRRYLLLLALSLLALVAMADGCDAEPVKEEYTCYGDLIGLQYDGEATDIYWKVKDESGHILKECAGSELEFDASEHDGLDVIYVTQTVTTDRGSSEAMIRINLMHLNEGSYCVAFFDSQNGNILDVTYFDATSVCRNGLFASLPEQPRRDDYAFAGWYVDEGDFQIEFSDRTLVDRSYDVYAKWLDIYTVLYKSEGYVVNNEKVVSGNLASPPVLAGNGRTAFVGWFVDERYNQAFDESSPVVDNMVLYAKWMDVLPDVEKESFNPVLVLPIILIAGVLAYFQVHRRRVLSARPRGRYGS